MPPSNVVDIALYEQVVKDSKKVYKRNSVYSSGWIVREYKKRGGRYRGDAKKAKRDGVNRWMRERWVQVIPYLTEGKVVACGDDLSRGDKSTKACRPLVRVNKQTPPTFVELLKIHSRAKLIALAKKKNRNMDMRVDWRAGTIK